MGEAIDAPLSCCWSVINAEPCGPLIDAQIGDDAAPDRAFDPWADACGFASGVLLADFVFVVVEGEHATNGEQRLEQPEVAAGIAVCIDDEQLYRAGLSGLLDLLLEGAAD